MSWTVVQHLRQLGRTLGGPILVLAITCWFLLSDWLSIPWAGLAALSCLALALALAVIWPAVLQRIPSGAALGFGWAASLAFPASLWFEQHRSHAPDLAYAWLAWLVALAVFVMSLCQERTPTRKRWQALGMTWALSGAAIWLVACYLQNDRAGFHVAILVALALIVLAKVAFRLPYLAVLAANTLILLLVLLPIIDFFVRPRYEPKPLGGDAKRLYSYEAARRDPEAFAAWWWAYYDQFHKMVAELGRTDTNQHASALPPFSHATFFQSSIRINNLGFRGADIPEEKGQVYRIIALGESTTFGATINPADKPWPQVLEQMIRERLKPRRPVQVINAGVFAITLQENLRRLPTEILPLKPDMLVSYHGINGFNLLDPAIPRLSGPRAPAYQRRPLKLLADAEYGIKMKFYRRKLVPNTPPSRIAKVPLLETDYARAYRQLVGVARTNHIHLVLANFSMAVNERSDPDVIAFYQAGFPSVYWQIQANLQHSMLVHQLAEVCPDVREVDTHPGLDGEHDKFIDLIHLTQEGRVQVAENIFAGIKELLQKDLSGD